MFLKIPLEKKHSRYCVPNEFICAKLGTAIGLPIPPFALSKYTDGAKRLLFSSLDFNPAGMRLPPVLPELCMQHLPFLCAGVIVFDAWIANEDRHEENLAVDKILAPKTMRIFDHDNALFGGRKLSGIVRLEALRDAVAITDQRITGGTEHCLLPHLTSDSHLETWVNRIECLDDWIIPDAVNTMVDRGISTKEGKVAIDFLQYRKGKMKNLILGGLRKHCGISTS